MQFSRLVGLCFKASMGARTAAAKWGLGLDLVTSIANGSLRRSSNLAATELVVKKAKGMELESNDKTLYLCFNELHHRKYLFQVIRPIRLNHYDDEKEEYLSEASSRRFRYRMSWTNCTSFGPRIVFLNGPRTSHVYSIDTSTRPVKFSRPKIPVEQVDDFSREGEVRLGNIDGKLYRFDVRYIICFEVLDPGVGHKWRRLEIPCFILDSKFNVAFLNASKKILCWELKKSRVLSFDTTKPENGWTAVPPALRDTLPFLNYTLNRVPNSPKFIHHYHSDIGDFHILFHYDPENEPLLVSPFYLSTNFDSFKAISNPIQLPILCREYLPLFRDPSCRESFRWVSSDFEFVILGNQKVGLVINKFNGGEFCRQKGLLLLIIFEYDVVVTTNSSVEEPTIEVQTRLLGTHRFAYNGRRVRVNGSNYPLNHINGAFWL